MTLSVIVNSAARQIPCSAEHISSCYYKSHGHKKYCGDTVRNKSFVCTEAVQHDGILVHGNRATVTRQLKITFNPGCALCQPLPANRQRGLSSTCQRRTEPRTWATCTKHLVMIARMSPEISFWTYRQTHICTRHNTSQPLPCAK